MKQKLLLPVVMFALLQLAGCSLFSTKEEDKTENWSAEQLYDEGHKRMLNKYYDGAVRYFEFLQQRYPFGVYAQQAQLELAYSYYKNSEHETALASLERFMKLYPTNPNMDYAYFLRGVVNFNANRGFSDRFLARDPSQRDNSTAVKSFQDFAELIQRFPESRYIGDARQRMIYLRNLLAQHEVNVAQYYMRRGAYVAAANRARYVVENYQQAPVMPEALATLAKAYTVMELDQLAADALHVLEVNYPNSPRIREIRRTVVD
ncbi:MAG: outer membrane protein assembly factor BamD [Gammaproteobacteria bacterium]|nr:outer membrane protein assembly factor BamD [Gammaproteobacteria bacterium]